MPPKFAAAAPLRPGSDEIGLDDFTFFCPRPADPKLRDRVQQSEATSLREVLVAHGGNATRAARSLNVPRTTW